MKLYEKTYRVQPIERYHPPNGKKVDEALGVRLRGIHFLASRNTVIHFLGLLVRRRSDGVCFTENEKRKGPASLF